MDSPEIESQTEVFRRFEADLNAYLMSQPTIPKKAIFSSTRTARFFGVSPSVVGNWAARYDTFPDSIKGDTQPTLYDIREVIRWWIHWNPENRNKSGSLPDNWKDWF